MKTISILFFFILTSQAVFADASPKFDPKIDIQLINGKIEKVDSIVIFVKYEGKINLDTLTTFGDTRKWWNVGGIDIYSSDKIIIKFREKVDFFKVVLHYNQNKYISDNIYPESSWNFLEFELRNKKLIPKFNLFFNKWSDYITSLLLTICLELFCISFFKRLRIHFKKIFIVVILMNLLTHPLLWYFNTHCDISLILLETGVMLTEILILTYTLRKTINFKIGIIYVSIANLFSWIIGGILFWIIRNS